MTSSVVPSPALLKRHVDKSRAVAVEPFMAANLKAEAIRGACKNKNGFNYVRVGVMITEKHVYFPL